jgi:hypothetical protein
MLCVKADVDIDTSVEFVVGNETFLMNNTSKSFNRVVIDDSYIMFNTTGINITSSNNITIFIEFVDADIENASENDSVFRFDADTASGSVSFKITGLRRSQEYNVYRNGTLFATQTSNLYGEITFSNSVWSRRGFDILQGESAVTPPQSVSGQAEIVIDILPILLSIMLLNFLFAVFLGGASTIFDVINLTVLMVVGIVAISII